MSATRRYDWFDGEVIFSVAVASVRSPRGSRDHRAHGSRSLDARAEALTVAQSWGRFQPRTFELAAGNDLETKLEVLRERVKRVRITTAKHDAQVEPSDEPSHVRSPAATYEAR